jgi:hypothetical protein
MTAGTAQSETQPILSALVAEQRRIGGILVNLDDDALRRPVLPSGWSCVGMVQHLTLMTRFWFYEVMTGRQVDPYVEDEFAVSAARPAVETLAAYQEAGRATADLIRALPFGTPPAWWPEDKWGGWRLDSFGEVLVHVLVETSSHAGHLDAARELIDGRTWDYARGQLSDPR